MIDSRAYTKQDGVWGVNIGAPRGCGEVLKHRMEGAKA